MRVGLKVRKKDRTVSVERMGERLCKFLDDARTMIHKPDLQASFKSGDMIGIEALDLLPLGTVLLWDEGYVCFIVKTEHGPRIKAVQTHGEEEFEEILFMTKPVGIGDKTGAAPYGRWIILAVGGFVF